MKKIAIVYDFDKSLVIEALAKEISKKKGYKIYTINVDKPKYADKCFNLDGPETFVSLVKNAQFVISNSFHAAVFSLVYEKDFVIVNRTESINTRMRDLLSSLTIGDRLIGKDYDINKNIYTKKEAIEIFKSIGLDEKAELIKYKENDIVKIYKCNNYIDHFYGYLMPSTGYIKSYDLFKYRNGVILMAASEDNKHIPKKFVPQPKLANIYKEAEEWSNLMSVDKVLSLNKIIEEKKYGEIIRIVEALHEKKIGQIADIIKQENKRIILIAAPSSSGKTSFATRLCIHLKVNNLNPVSISLDDYFVDREETPLDEFGNYNYRSCEDIQEAVKPLLKQNKAVLLVTDNLELIGSRYYLKATAKLIDIEDGSQVENTAFAREPEDKKKMDAAQVTGSCSSYARKYALNGLFCIDDTKDPDTQKPEEEPQKPQPKKQQEARPEYIGDNEVKELMSEAYRTNTDMSKVCERYKVSNIRHLTMQNFRGAMYSFALMPTVYGE